MAYSKYDRLVLTACLGQMMTLRGLIVQVQMLNEKWKVLNSLLRCRLRFKINRRTAMRENRQLTKAKSAKNDEFYTQYANIQKELST